MHTYKSRQEYLVAYKATKGLRVANGPPPSCKNRSHSHRSYSDHCSSGEVAPETNSFHLPSSKATVTLEDVAYIYGLPIDGPLVAGRTFPGKLVAPMCEEVLGITIEKKIDCVAITVKFK